MGSPMENTKPSPSRQRCTDIAMHENSMESRRLHENQVFSLHFFDLFFRPPFSLAFDGVRWFSLFHHHTTFFSHFTFFERIFRGRAAARRVGGQIERINLGTYSLLSSLRSGADSPVCSVVQQTMSYEVAHSS